MSRRGQGSWSLLLPVVVVELDMRSKLGPVALERQPPGLPVDETSRVVADVPIAVRAQLGDRRQAGVAVEVRAIDDDLLVLAERGEHLLGALEVDRPRDVLGAEAPVAGGHHQLEGLAARELGPKLLTIEIGGSWLGAGHSRDLAGRRPAVDR